MNIQDSIGWRNEDILCPNGVNRRTRFTPLPCKQCLRDLMGSSHTVEKQGCSSGSLPPKLVIWSHLKVGHEILPMHSLVYLDNSRSHISS